MGVAIKPDRGVILPLGWLACRVMEQTKFSEAAQGEIHLGIPAGRQVRWSLVANLLGMARSRGLTV